MELTGAAHDATAFRAYSSFQASWISIWRTRICMDWLGFWYPLGEWVIPVHKDASLKSLPQWSLTRLSHIYELRSEHYMRALKGCFQCLRGLRVNIKFTRRPYQSLTMITCAIILHNLIIDVEGEVSGAHFQPLHRHIEEERILGFWWRGEWR